MEENERLQATELAIFKSFVECCEKLGTKYYIIGGSLLGAIRHGGFIPWDDDIDVGMMRSDYEKFLKQGQKYLPDYYFIQSLYSEPNILFNFAKIRDSRTTFIESSIKNARINHGVYIDIFPLDFYPENQKEQKRIDRKRRILGWRIRKELSLPKENKDKLVSEIFRKGMGRILCVRYPRVRKAIEKRELLYSSVAPSNLLINYSGAYGKKEIADIGWYGEGEMKVFEDIMVRVPSKYDEMLRKIYGDYMCFPPKEKRVAHHYTEVMDLDTPYTKYFK